MANLTHLNDLGDAEMVDITSKDPTARTATAEALVDLTPKVAKAISDKTAACTKPSKEAKSK